MRNFLRSLFVTSASQPHSAFTEIPESVEAPLFVYVKMPGEIQPIERGERFEDPLQKEFDRSQVGEVTGGGSMLTAPDEEGRRFVEYCGIDIDFVKPRAGLSLLVHHLRRLRAPRGTTIEFTFNDQSVVFDIYEETN